MLSGSRREVESKMNIEINVPDGKSGEWEVSTFTVSNDDAKLFNLREMMHRSCRTIYPGTYKKLTRNNYIIMSNTPAEIRDHIHFIHLASGSVLINGLGLGVAFSAILKKDTVSNVTIIEKSKDVIDLVAPTYLQDKRVEIINEDAFEFKPPKNKKYDFVWHDIWDDICADNLSEMIKLHRKYARKTSWQDSWCRWECKRRK